MSDYKTTFSQNLFLFRKAFLSGAANDVIIPSACGFVRIGAVGAGGWHGWVNGVGIFGGGSAYAFDKFAVNPNEHLTVQVGDTTHSQDNGDSLGNSIVTRVTGSVVKVLADRGRGGTTGGNKGLASNCTGSVKRDGSDGATTSTSGGGIYNGGASGGDDIDTFPLGFGGRGAQLDMSLATYALAAERGGGGAMTVGLFPGGQPASPATDFPAGAGKVIIEFFRSDPGF